MQASFARELRQAQRELRVRDDLRPVVVKPGRGETVAERVALAALEPVTAVQLRKRDPLRRVLGVQVEREPRDLGVELAPRLLGRYLAEPAERSDVVAPDENRMFGHDDSL
jgi:hypothetical protein